MEVTSILCEAAVHVRLQERADRALAACLRADRDIEGRQLFEQRLWRLPVANIALLERDPPHAGDPGPGILHN